MSRIRFLSALAALALSASACAAAGINPAQLASGDAAWANSNVSDVPVLSLPADAPERGSVSAMTDGTARGRTAQATTPLTVEIIGSSRAPSGDYNCYFVASTSGGTGSGYTYTWSVLNGDGWGTASGNSWTGGGTSDFTLEVTVTDSGNGQASDTHFVDVGGWFPCLY